MGSFEFAFLEHISVYEGDDDPLKKRSKAEMLIAGKSPMHKAFVIICYCNSSTTMSSLDDLETTHHPRRDLTRSNSPIAGSPIVMNMIPAYPSSYDLAMSYPLCHFAGDVLAYAVACLISKSSGFRLIEFS